MFLARGYQHLLWETPLQEFDVLQKGIGGFYLLCSLAAILLSPKRAWLGTILLGGSLSLAILSFLYFRERSYQVGQFIEHSLQWSIPLFLIYFIRDGINSQTIRNLLRAVIALTFIGHGLYAVGFYPVPGNFVDMTIACLGLNEPEALLFLKVAGYLDFVVAVGIFLPKADRYILIYATIWGGLTALARIYANFDATFPGESLSEWLHETIFRLPHAAGPFAMFLLATQAYRNGTYHWQLSKRKSNP